eukprot:TRINITY_DN545_c0_g2_i1.p1 TRINITY_DN545_c0_g2~~TRINITY_DN545_c0_g2_i1.p1  ORF type:complete len:503 (+),score=194.19 TRINITY_DN545_c0_g2_i1:50-1558(+)
MLCKKLFKFKKTLKLNSNLFKTNIKFKKSFSTLFSKQILIFTNNSNLTNNSIFKNTFLSKQIFIRNYSKNKIGKNEENEDEEDEEEVKIPRRPFIDPKEKNLDFYEPPSTNFGEIEREFTLDYWDIIDEDNIEKEKENKKEKKKEEEIKYDYDSEEAREEGRERQERKHRENEKGEKLDYLKYFGFLVGAFLIANLYNSADNRFKSKEPIIIASSIVNILLRISSGIFYIFAELPLPKFFRVFLFKAWSNFYGCNLSEMQYPLESYSCLGDFFARPLKSGVRKIDAKAELVSPVDALVMSCGAVQDNDAIQVKKTPFLVNDFLGLESALPPNLFYIVLYLSPADYHGFHCPVDNFEIENTHHIPGGLFPVSKWFMLRQKNLLVENERVVIFGKWRHGIFTYSPVGATNVGSIVLDFAPQIRTNLATDYYSFGHVRNYETSSTASKGQKIGTFRMGSTVVLIFQAPPSFEFEVVPDQKIKIGQRLSKPIEEEIKPSKRNLGYD